MSDAVNMKRRGGRRKAAPVENAEVPVVMTVDAPVSPQSAHVPASTPLMLTQEELHRMRHYEAEARAARAEAETSRIRKKYILSILDKKGLVESEEKNQEKHIEKSKDWAKRHEMLIAQISIRLNIDLKTCAFDTDTGLVVPPDSATGRK